MGDSLDSQGGCHLIDTEIAIVGAGMVGTSLALGLAEAGFTVTLLEQREPACDWPAESYDLRVSAITRASQHIFEHLGVWSKMQSQRVTAYQKMRVWDAGGSAEIAFDAADIGEPDLGHIIENRIIQCALWERFNSLKDIHLRCPGTVTALDLGGEHPQLELADNRVLGAQLVIAADGANSPLRSMAGIAVKGWAYDQVGLVATIRPELGNQQTAWQRFMPDGPLALLPLNDDLLSIVWSTTPEQAELLQGMPVEEFEAALAAAADHRLGEMSLVGERRGFPLRLQHATDYVRPGLALVGDAAHVIHPLAGQGVNLGLLDAAEMVDTLIEARRQGRPLGGLPTLRRYQRARKGENIAVQMAMDGFKRLFSNDLKPLQVLRNIGMLAANNSGPIKDQLMRTAMGVAGDLPSLACPVEIHRASGRS